MYDISHSLIIQLRDKRRSLHLSQGDLAKKIGVSKTSVLYWERERFNPSFINLCSWCLALGVTITLTPYTPDPLPF